MSVRATIETKLSAALQPEHLEVIDNSAQHAGHAGSRPEGESHFAVLVVSSVFDGQNRVQRQRMVYKALADEMINQIHALELKTFAPGEVQG